ncbi:Hypothetical predicted protein [Olea europaea subsp. europaea]|uniref:Protein TIFY n=2 Tax=Olea europaea subsp. europaea TaxID=158383 RepID=A0A8S0SNE3_OLEEU|nr:Hypothetical predicted protein [Olea europaea subsp. europaea]
MERNFLGFTVKQGTPDETTDPGPARSLAMQWSFSSKVSAPQVLSFQGTPENKLKTGFDSLSSTRLVTITTADATDSSLKPYSGVVQENVIPEKQGGLYTMATYPGQHLFAHTITSAASNPVHQSVISTAGQNLIGTAILQPPLENSIQNPVHFVPSGSSVVGTTDLWNASTPSGTPSQLTIFYAGSVCVYDNVNPEKAQAIMLLAGNGPPTTATTPFPTTPLQALMPRSFSTNGFVDSQPYGTLRRSTPIPLTPVSASKSPRASGSDNNIMVVEPIRSVPATFLSPDAVPQARRKSLARFLEKRKVRVNNTSPYSNKESPEANPGSGSTSSSVSPL